MCVCVCVVCDLEGVSMTERVGCQCSTIQPVSPLSRCSSPHYFKCFRLNWGATIEADHHMSLVASSY